MPEPGLPQGSHLALILQAQTTADIVNRFMAAAGNMLDGQAPNDTVSLQAISALPQWSSMKLISKTVSRDVGGLNDLAASLWAEKIEKDPLAFRFLAGDGQGQLSIFIKAGP
ncbi:MAG: hypothetical protein PVG51_18825, partial [Desulfosarcina sp.]